MAADTSPSLSPRHLGVLQRDTRLLHVFSRAAGTWRLDHAFRWHQRRYAVPSAMVSATRDPEEPLSR